MQRICTMGTVFALASALFFAGTAVAQNGRLKLDLGDLTSLAKEAVNISIDQSTLEWAMEGIESEGGDAQELKELMKDLGEINIQVLEFDRENAPPWDKLVEAAQGVLKVIDGPEYQPIVSVTEKNGDATEMVRVSLFKDSTGKIAGLTVFVLEPNEIALVNLVGSIKLNQLSKLGKALGQPGLLDSLTGKSAPSAQTVGE